MDKIENLENLRERLLEQVVYYVEYGILRKDSGHGERCMLKPTLSYPLDLPNGAGRLLSSSVRVNSLFFIRPIGFLNYTGPPTQSL